MLVCHVGTLSWYVTLVRYVGMSRWYVMFDMSLWYVMLVCHIDLSRHVTLMSCWYVKLASPVGISCCYVMLLCILVGHGMKRWLVMSISHVDMPC